MRRLVHKKMRNLTLGHTANNWERKDSNSGALLHRKNGAASTETDELEGVMGTGVGVGEGCGDDAVEELSVGWPLFFFLMVGWSSLQCDGAGAGWTLCKKWFLSVLSVDHSRKSRAGSHKAHRLYSLSCRGVPGVNSASPGPGSPISLWQLRLGHHSNSCFDSPYPGLTFEASDQTRSYPCQGTGSLFRLCPLVLSTDPVQHSHDVCWKLLVPECLKTGHVGLRDTVPIQVPCDHHILFDPAV